MRISSPGWPPQSLWLRWVLPWCVHRSSTSAELWGGELPAVSFVKKLFRAHFWWYSCNFCLVTKGFARAIHFHFEIKYLNTSSSCAYLARSEPLQTPGRTPGQWSVSSLHIACQELCQKAILAISLGLMKKDLHLPLHVLKGDPATTIIVIWSCQEKWEVLFVKD